MATDWGRVGAGFVKGVADYATDQIKAQQDEDRQLRRAQLLEQLRVSTEERLAKFRDELDRKKTDKDFSGIEGEEMIYRDRDGNETSRRPITATERTALEYQSKERDLKLRSGEQDIAASQAGIRQGDERLALTRRGQDLDAAAARERNSIARMAGAKGSGGEDGDISSGVSSTAIGYQLTELNTDAVKQAMQAGVPREEIQRMASIIAAQQMAKGDRNVEMMNDKFLRGLSELRKGVEGTGDDATWSLATFNKTRADEAKKK